VDGDLALAGANAAGRWARPLALAAIASTLAACAALQQPPAGPLPEAAQSYPPDIFPLAPATEPTATDVGADEPPAPGQEPPAPAQEPPAPAQEPPAPAQEPPVEPVETDNLLESTRRSVRSTTEWLARGVDSWFGDQPFEQGGAVKDGRLSIGLFKRQGERLDPRLRFRARFKLPNVERRAYLFIGRDNEAEVVSDTPEAFSRQERLLAETREERSFFTGLGVSLREALHLRIGFQGIKPYAQAVYREPWTLGLRDLVEFRQTFFWRLSDRFGSTTVLSYEHAVAPDLALRWLSAVTITQKTDRFDWSSVAGAYKSFDSQRLLSLEAIVSGRVGEPVALGEYGLQTKWMQPVYRDWLLGEFLAGYFWPRTELATPRSRRWALGFTLTMQF
jgi:hypothetical protein